MGSEQPTPVGGQRAYLSPLQAYLIFVYEAPDACSHLTGKQDHKAGEELGERRGQSLDQQAQA